MSTPRKAIVVGAGPVGCLAAIALAKQGWRVDVFEGRPDARLPSSKAAASLRSINLAISSRGISAIEAIDQGAAARFLDTVIPMRGRMIHHTNGKLDSQLYDRDGQCINSIDRGLLNETLLDEASNASDIHLHFEHKVETIDFDAKTAAIREIHTEQAKHVSFDLCIGTDGSYSVVRRQMMRVVRSAVSVFLESNTQLIPLSSHAHLFSHLPARMDFMQEYIPHEYVELKIPAGRDEKGDPIFLISPDHLHIWPRHSFMLIALPNKDRTFTCTVFAPTDELDRLNTQPAALVWFKKYFPDALQLMGEDAALNDFINNPRSPLICTKSKPYHYKDCAILLGDAAHSMVPFYGQGLNCGLEDVRVLDTLLRQEAVNTSNSSTDILGDAWVGRALARYSDSRHEDLIAIADMAMENYYEMRHAVTTPLFRFKKTLDNILYALSSRKYVSVASLVPLLSRVPFPHKEPRGWLPLYTMVTFRPDISYATAKKKAKRQAIILAGSAWLTSGILGAAGIWVAWTSYFHRFHVQQ